MFVVLGKNITINNLIFTNGNWSYNNVFCLFI